MEETIKKLAKKISTDRVKQDEPLAKHLNFRIGGPADLFIEVRTIEELQHAIKVMSDEDVRYFILGGGSNTLVADEGFRGACIKLALRDHQITDTTVTAGAGMISAALARITASAGLEGFEWAISLPGTIGGAVRGNAGCFGGEMKDSVTSVKILRNHEVIDIQAVDLNFGYRESAIKHSEDIVLEATLELKPGKAEELKAKLTDHLNARKSSQPLYAGSAGCMFKNYDIVSQEELESIKTKLDIPEPMIKSMRLSSGWIIDQMGLKGYQVGGAKISDEHGNFVVNLGEAKAEDVMAIVNHVKEQAKEQFGINLHDEVQYIQ